MTLRFRKPKPAMDALDIGPLKLTARDVAFDLSATPLHWIPGYPVASHVISAYHLLFPEVERFFIEAFTEALPHIRDTRLREDILGFIGQETMHANTHEESLEDFFGRNGIDPAPPLAQARFLLREVLGHRDFADDKRARQYLIDRLAIVAALENFTAFLGHFALNCRWPERGADPAMVALFRWHGAEEMEHRTVAHDVAMYFDPRYSRRLRMTLLTLPLTIWISARFMWYLISNDPTIRVTRRRAWLDVLRGGRDGVLPTVWTVLKSMVDYLRPGYTPDDTGSMAQALGYLATVEARGKAA